MLPRSEPKRNEARPTRMHTALHSNSPYVYIHHTHQPFKYCPFARPI